MKFLLSLIYLSIIQGFSLTPPLTSSGAPPQRKSSTHMNKSPATSVLTIDDLKQNGFDNVNDDISKIFARARMLNDPGPEGARMREEARKKMSFEPIPEPPHKSEKTRLKRKQRLEERRIPTIEEAYPDEEPERQRRRLVRKAMTQVMNLMSAKQWAKEQQEMEARQTGRQTLPSTAGESGAEKRPGGMKSQQRANKKEVMKRFSELLRDEKTLHQLMQGPRAPQLKFLRRVATREVRRMERDEEKQRAAEEAEAKARRSSSASRKNANKDATASEANRKHGDDAERKEKKDDCERRRDREDKKATLRLRGGWAGLEHNLRLRGGGEIEKEKASTPSSVPGAAKAKASAPAGRLSAVVAWVAGWLQAWAQAGAAAVDKWMRELARRWSLKDLTELGLRMVGWRGGGEETAGDGKDTDGDNSLTTVAMSKVGKVFETPPGLRAEAFQGLQGQVVVLVTNNAVFAEEDLAAVLPTRKNVNITEEELARLPPVTLKPGTVEIIQHLARIADLYLITQLPHLDVDSVQHYFEAMVLESPDSVHGVWAHDIPERRVLKALRDAGVLSNEKEPSEGVIECKCLFCETLDGRGFMTRSLGETQSPSGFTAMYIDDSPQSIGWLQKYITTTPEAARRGQNVCRNTKVLGIRTAANGGDFEAPRHKEVAPVVVIDSLPAYFAKEAGKD